MKTSNKILLALFTLPLVVTIFVYGNLYAKFKNNDFITDKQLEEERTISTSLSAFHTIDLTDYKGDHAVNFIKGDQYAFSIDKSEKERFSFDESNGILKIKSGRDFHSRVTITCPDFQNLIADSSGIINLNDLHLNKLDCRLGYYANLRLNANIDSLTIVMKELSNLEISENAKIGTLNLQMKDEAKLEQSGGEVEAFGNVSISDRCLIKVNGKTMQRLLQKTSQQ